MASSLHPSRSARTQFPDPRPLEAPLPETAPGEAPAPPPGPNPDAAVGVDAIALWIWLGGAGILMALHVWRHVVDFFGWWI